MELEDLRGMQDVVLCSAFRRDGNDISKQGLTSLPWDINTMSCTESRVILMRCGQDRALQCLNYVYILDSGNPAH